MPTLPHLFSAALCLLPAALHAAFPTLHLKPVVLDQLVSPVNISSADDGSGRLFVCEQQGVIRIVQGGMLLPTPFLDISGTRMDLTLSSTGPSEFGLLGLAFHPDYANAGEPGHRKFYVYYSASSDIAGAAPIHHMSVIAEYTASASNPNVADFASERVLLKFNQPQGNHNGGQLQFGPDGFLYISTGDGGSRDDNRSGHTGGDNTSPPLDNLGNSQDRSNLLGKILRIDPLGTNGPGGSYGIPAGNPFVGVAGVREEIFAFGLRNPWRFSFDDLGPGHTDRLFCADVGQGLVEEVNLIVAGGNYGWRRFEGTFDLFAGTPNPSGIAPTPPIAQYAHPGAGPTTGLTEFGISITGGFIYRGAAIPALQGKYLFADYSQSSSAQGILLGVEETSPGVFGPVTALALTQGNPLATRILAMGRDEQGELYLATKVARGATQTNGGVPTGAIYKITGLASQTVHLTADRDNSMFEGTSNSNGAGPHLYAGRTGSSGGDALRRALVRFNVSSIPPGTPVSSATVTMDHTLAGSVPVTMTLHRVTEDWGEGASNAGQPGGLGAAAQTGDATWTRRFFNTQSWTTSGGTFLAAVSGSAVMTSVPNSNAFVTEFIPRTWTGAGIGSDVQFWIDNPSSNFGWIVRGDEVNTFTAQRFASRENPDDGGTHAPRLTINYAAPPSPLPFENFLSTHYPTALVGEFIDPNGDDDGDGIPLQVEHAYGFSPLAFNAPSSTGFGTALAPAGGGATTLSVTFRRNPNATDLTYNLQIGGNLSTWTTIATSTAGAPAAGVNGGTVTSDAEISGQAPVRLVTLQFTLPPGTTAQFVRLETLRSL